MTVLLLLIAASLAIALLFLGVFVWAVKSGQFEDTCTPAMRVVMEETESEIFGTERRTSTKASGYRAAVEASKEKNIHLNPTH